MKTFLSFIASILLACSLHAQTVNTTTNSLNIGYKSADSVSFDVTANTYWGILNLPVWLYTDTSWFNGNQTVKLYVAENPLFINRKATFDLYWFDSNNSYASKSITITQASTGAGVSRNSLSLDANKTSTDTFSIKSKYYWEFQTLPSWIKINNNYTTGNSALTITALEDNPLYTSRSANFKLLRVTSDTSETTSAMIVTQAASTEGVSDNLVLVTAAEGSMAQFDIRTNNSWQISSNSTQFTFTPTSGTGNDTIHISAKINTYAYYKADTVFVTINNIKKIAVIVAQQPASAYCNTTPSSFNFGAWSGSSVACTVKSNTAWGVDSLPNWLNIDSLFGYADSNFTLSSKQNPLTKARSKTSTLYWFDGNNAYYSKKITFTQAAAEFGLSSDTLLFDATQSSKNLDVTSSTLWHLADAPSWISFDKDWMTNSQSVTFTTDANPLNANRVDSVHFIRYNGTEIVGSSTITVIQPAATNGVSDTLVVFSAVASETLKVAITASSSWTILSKPSWINTNKSTGSGNDTLKITAAANAETYYRGGAIIVSFGTKTVRISVNQFPTEAIVSINPGQINLIAGQNTSSLQIKSNTSWNTYISASWLNFDTISGYKDSTISIIAEENFLTTKRTDTVSIGWYNNAIYNEKKVSVTQAASTYGLSNNFFELNAEAGSNASFMVSSNSIWEIVDIPSWLTLDNNYQSGSAKITITAQANPLSTPRKHVLTFHRYYTASDYYITTITVTQKASANGVAQLSYSVAAKQNSTVQVSVSSTTNWSISGLANWLSTTNTANYATITAQANPSTSSRIDTATIVWANGQTIEITIIQEAAQANLTVSNSNINLVSSQTTSNLAITTNAEWGISNTSNWLKIDTLWGIGSYTIKLTAQENTNINTRTTNILIYWYDANKNYYDTTVNITQAGTGLSLLVSPILSSCIANGESKDIQITSNVQWNAVSNSSWITISQSSGSESANIKYTAAPNLRMSTRNASITISGLGVTSQTITITQIAAQAQLSISNTAYNTNASASQTQFTINSNTSWTISSSNTSWLTVSTPSGIDSSSTVSFSCSENTSTQARTAIITITGTSISNQTITVTQAAATAKLLISDASLNYTASKESKTITINSNIAWSVNADQEWVKFSNTGGTGSSSVIITADTNKTTSIRIATITIAGNGGINKTILVTQAANVAYLNVDKQNFTITSSAKTEYLTINSNINWTITSNNANWLTFSNTAGNSSQIIAIYANENTSTTARPASITIEGSGVPSQTISINQDAAPANLSISLNTIFIPATSNKAGYFIINTNQSWTISSADSWLSLNTENGTNTDTIVLAASENSSINSRTASITITAQNGTKKTVSVIQSATATNLTVSTTWIEVGSIASTTSNFTIASNNNWQIKCTSSWLTLSSTAGIDTAKILLFIKENTADTARIATIELHDADDSVSYVFVQQAAHVTSINDNAINEIKTFPNPVNTYLTIESPEAINIQNVSIYSTDGQKLIQQQNIEKKQIFDFSQLPVGMYLLQLSIDNQTITRTITKN